MRDVLTAVTSVFILRPFTSARLSEAEDGVELQTGQRAVERAGRRLAEDAEQPRRPLREEGREGERDARVERVADEEAVDAHVGREPEVAPVEGRKDGVLLRADERVVEERVAALDRIIRGRAQDVFADLKLGPVALPLIVRQQRVNAARPGRDDVARLRVGDEVEEQHDRPTLAAREVGARDEVYEVEARGETAVAVDGVRVREREAEVGVARDEQVARDGDLRRDGARGGRARRGDDDGDGELYVRAEDLRGRDELRPREVEV